MNKASALHALLTRIANEHRDLQRRLRDLRCLVQEVETGPAIAQALVKAVASLTVLREQMRLHFAEEAEGGVIEEAVARLPRLAGEAAVIEREHPELLLCLDQTIQFAAQAGPSTDEWDKVRGSVEAFVVRMLAHEAAEDRLLQLGFNEDI